MKTKLSTLISVTAWILGPVVAVSNYGLTADFSICLTVGCLMTIGAFIFAYGRGYDDSTKDQWVANSDCMLIDPEVQRALGRMNLAAKSVEETARKPYDLNRIIIQPRTTRDKDDETKIFHREGWK